MVWSHVALVLQKRNAPQNSWFTLNVTLGVRDFVSWLKFFQIIMLVIYAMKKVIPHNPSAVRQILSRMRQKTLKKHDARWSYVCTHASQYLYLAKSVPVPCKYASQYLYLAKSVLVPCKYASQYLCLAKSVPVPCTQACRVWTHDMHDEKKAHAGQPAHDLTHPPSIPCSMCLPPHAPPPSTCWAKH